MGGEELKTHLLSILFFGIWFLIQIPSVSSQEIEAQENLPAAEAESADPRAAERDILINADAAAVPQAGGNSSIFAIVRMILALALAAAAIYGVVFFIKRSSKGTAGSDPFLKILASAHLGSNRYAHIIAVGSKAWLLGSSDGGVNLIGEIEDKDVVNAMLIEDSRKTAEVSSGRFPDFLSMLRRMGARPESRSSEADDIRKRRERLRGL